MQIDNKYNICLITHPFGVSKNTGRGMERHAFDFLSTLNSKGINVNLATTEYHNSLIKAAVKEISFPFKFIRESAGIYHALSPTGSKTAIMLGKRPIVTEIHDLIPFHRSNYEHSLLYKYHRFCIKFSAKHSDKLIVHFNCHKEELISTFNIPESKIEVIRLAIDHTAFCPLPDFKKENKIKKILFVGSITRSKGVDSLIKAFRLVMEEMRSVELLLGGKEVGGRKKQDQAYIKELPEKLGVADRVKFLGFIPEDQLPIFYNKADVVVFPSDYGFGLPVIEAMACGTPTIAGDSLEGPEGYGGASILVEPGNVDQLASAIIRVLTDSKLREKFVKRGLKYAKLFSWEARMHSVIDLYSSLLIKKERERSK